MGHAKQGSGQTSLPIFARKSSPSDPQEENVEIACRRKILAADLESRRPGLRHAGFAETDQRIRRTLVDGEMKIADRPGPIGAGLQHVSDLVFGRRRAIVFALERLRPRNKGAVRAITPLIVA